MSEQGGSWPRALGGVTAGLAERARGEVVVRTLVSTGASSSAVRSLRELHGCRTSSWGF
eukprot:SAG25_NODE_32_length_20323_cov_59.467721_22_plen_59_part_00